MFAALLIVLLATPPLPAQATGIGGHPLVGPEARLLGWLMAQKKIGPPADEDRLDELLRDGETVHLDGGTRSAAVVFSALLLDPAFAKLAKTSAYDNARFHLAGALIHEGAYGRARRLLLELISRRPASDFRAPAFRRLIDLTLRSGQFEQSLSALDGLSFEPSRDELDEIAYVKGKALMRLGYKDQAAAALEAVSRSSRLHAAAAYLSGILLLDGGDMQAAEDRFCKLVYQPGEGRYTFFLSDGAAKVIEYAWLALARIRHDREEYVRSVETYDRIASSSPLAVTAAYEASWSLFRTGDYAATREQLRDLLASGASLGERPAARLLLGYALLGDCLFEPAKQLFASLERELTALTAALASKGASDHAIPSLVRPWATRDRYEHTVEDIWRSLVDSTRRLEWLRAEFSRVASGMPRQEPPRPKRALTTRLGQVLSKAGSLEHRLADLRARIGTTESGRASLDELQKLQEQVAQARSRAERTLERVRAGRYTGPKAPIAPGPQIPSDYLADESQFLDSLATTLSVQREKAMAMRKVATKKRATRARDRVAAWARQAKLGHVDAVIGHKQALETEVQNLALGRYPLSLLRELAGAGVLDETTEYWPYEGESWPDEYE